MGDFAKIILLIQGSVLWVGLAGLVFLGLIAVSRFQIRIVRHTWQQTRRLGFVSLAVAGLLTGVFALHGGSKNTNGVPPRAGATMRVTGTAGTNTNGLDRTGNVSQAITDEDISNGWRVVSMSTSALPQSTFEMPTNAVVWEAPLRRGALRDRWCVPAGSWSFPFGDTVWTNGFFFTDQGFRGNLQDRANRIVLLGDEPLGLCPFANWSRWGLSASRAWCVTNGTRGATFAFENAAVGDDPAKIVSAQLELVPDECEVRLRYDLSQVGTNTYSVGVVERGTNTCAEVGSNVTEVVLRRVLSDDWDADGLANALDPHPLDGEVPSVWNQGTAWAQLSFPSYSNEIASVGYAEWVVGTAATNALGRLVGISLDENVGPLPTRLAVGDCEVMCDGRSELLFPIDCGARVPFSVRSGRIAAFSCRATNETARLSLPEDSAPCEFRVGDLTVHLDTALSGWVCRSAEVTVDADGLDHLSSDTSHHLRADMEFCAPATLLGQTWSGGTGLTFSAPHSAQTDVSWTGSDFWTTNQIFHVADFLGGYSITNVLSISTGAYAEPTNEFSITCPKVFFLNDADFFADPESSTNRPERIRAVSFNLRAPRGAAGSISVTGSGAADPVIVEENPNGGWTRVLPTTAIPISLTNDWTRTGGVTVYMSCPKTGWGNLQATLTLTNGETCTATADFRCIEPLRKFVTTERTADNRFVNPSRLVYGTNATLRVGVNPSGLFSADEVCWSVVSGPGQITSPTNGWEVTVEATATNGEVVVEARFNDDEIQPRFVLPIVLQRIIPVRAFVVSPPVALSNSKWRDADIVRMFDEVNEIYTQVGISFVLATNIFHVGRSSDWTLPEYDVKTNTTGSVKRLSAQARQLLDSYASNDCVEMYFVGHITTPGVVGFRSSRGIVVSRSAKGKTLAHELGHVLGLQDCYPIVRHGNSRVYLPAATQCVDGAVFLGSSGDWGNEQGRGFYELTDWRINIIRKILMLGYDNSGAEDIPNGLIISLRGAASYSQDTCFVRVGARFIEPDNRKVYSK